VPIVLYGRSTGEQDVAGFVPLVRTGSWPEGPRCSRTGLGGNFELIDMLVVAAIASVAKGMIAGVLRII
jgi:hypothetical protein